MTTKRLLSAGLGRYVIGSIVGILWIYASIAAAASPASDDENAAARGSLAQLGDAIAAADMKTIDASFAGSDTTKPNPIAAMARLAVAERRLNMAATSKFGAGGAKIVSEEPDVVAELNDILQNLDYKHATKNGDILIIPVTQRENAGDAALSAEVACFRKQGKKWLLDPWETMERNNPDSDMAEQVQFCDSQARVANATADAIESGRAHSLADAIALAETISKQELAHVLPATRPSPALGTGAGNAATSQPGQ